MFNLSKTLVYGLAFLAWAILLSQWLTTTDTKQVQNVRPLPIPGQPAGQLPPIDEVLKAIRSELKTDTGIYTDSNGYSIYIQE